MGVLFSSTGLAIVGILLGLILVAVIIVKRLQLPKPDQALIIAGRKDKINGSGANDGEGIGDNTGLKVITEGRVFVIPFVQNSYRISLHSRQLNLNTRAQTINGITIDAKAVAIIKIGGSENMIRAAAQRFLNQDNGQIEESTREVLNGSLRAIIGGLSVQQIIKDRADVSRQVLEAAAEALNRQGLVIDTFQIQDISDEDSYIDNIGRPEAAEVRKQAEIADIRSDRESAQARIQAEQEIVNAQRELSLRKAEVQAEIDRANATAEASRPLEEAKQQQIVVAEQEITATKKALLREQELKAEVNVIADAEAYRVRTIADAERDSAIAAAEAQKQSRTLAADAVRAEGVANADAVRATGLAEAEAIKARTDAFANEDAKNVLAQMIIERLVPMSAEFAKGYSAIEKLTVISADGANRTQTDIAGGMAGVTQSLKDAVGIDLQEIIQGTAVGRGIASGAAETPGTRVITDDNGKALFAVETVEAPESPFSKD